MDENELERLREVRRLVVRLIDQSYRDNRGYIKVDNETWKAIEAEIGAKSVDMSAPGIKPYPWQR